jgi:hypothetical protein
VEARERSLTTSPPFPLALAVVLLSFLHTEPDFRDSIFRNGSLSLVLAATYRGVTSRHRFKHNSD